MTAKLPYKCKGCDNMVEPKRWKPEYCSLTCAKNHTGYDHTNHPWRVADYLKGVTK